MVKILGTGSYLPPKIVTNDDLAKTLDTSDEWIYSHSGIHSRHVVEEGDTTAIMATKAARIALETAGVTPDEIKMIIVATCSPDYHPLPSSACLVQDALGCKNAFAFDLSAACSGFIFGLEQARGYLMLHPDAKVLVIGSESLSRIVDWTDRSTCMLFGDGAGAAVLGTCDDSEGEKAYSFLGSDGSGYDAIYREGGVTEPPSLTPRPDPLLKMDGKKVFQFAIKIMPAVIERLCGDAGMSPDAIDVVVPHQANIRIIESAAKRVGIPMEKMFVNLEHIANTSGASIAIAVDHAIRSGKLKDGQRTCLVGFGSGLTYGGLLMRWPYL